MTDYKAEIENILMDVEESSKKYGFTPSVNKCLSLFREIAKEGYIEIAKQLKDHAVAESDDIYFIKIQKKSLDEILSNIEKLL